MIHVDRQFFIGKLKKLKNLTFLDISGNHFNGTLSFKEFSTFKRLEILNLEGNAFTGCILEDIWALLSLKALHLYGNKFSGSLLKQSLCSLKDLQHLDLSYNEFGGTLPRCLGNLTSLTILDLSGNQLTGYLPSFWPPKLQYVDLSHNHLEGLFSFNYSSLENGWIPSFQLRTLIMQDCGLESIPEFLFHQFKLEVLDLSHNKQKGRFPYWLLHNNGGLEILNLMNNSFNGQLEIGAKMLSSMTYLNLARNHFEGDLLFSGDNCKLIALDLSHNNFSGKVPEKLLSNCISLRFLRLSHNNFHGQIALFNLTRIADLQLNDNQFEGTLSSLLTNFSHQSYGPKVLHLSNNQLHGEIPHWMGNITGLEYLNLRDNLFQGNRFSGSIPETLLNISTLNSLDLSDNELSSTILNKSGENLSGLRVLLLRGNHFSGFIPNWLEGEGPLYGPLSDKLVEWGIGYWGGSEILLDNTASFDAEVDEKNDSLLFFNARLDEADSIKSILNTYAATSGQVVNFNKSDIFFSFNVVSSVRSNISNILNVHSLLSHNVYLMLHSLIGRIKKLLVGSKREGRRGTNWLAWEKMCSRKEVFKAKYFPNGDLFSANVSNGASFVWKSVMTSRELIRRGTRWRVGNGEKILVASAPWIPKEDIFFANDGPDFIELHLRVCDLFKEIMVSKELIIMKPDLVEDVLHNILDWEAAQRTGALHGNTTATLYHGRNLFYFSNSARDPEAIPLQIRVSSSSLGNFSWFCQDDGVLFQVQDFIGYSFVMENSDSIFKCGVFSFLEGCLHIVQALQSTHLDISELNLILNDCKSLLDYRTNISVR
ncbi:receptor-like protein 56 [Manihot esculenta]|uniref:receptor-like protein 56 n=1 Tax=Manihot esculenta TaxID=3983 RepID=UPI001CC7EF83|nr:receptor-like protein 56 [Manihot esculenta]